MSLVKSYLYLFFTQAREMRQNYILSDFFICLPCCLLKIHLIGIRSVEQESLKYNSKAMEMERIKMTDKTENIHKMAQEMRLI